MTWVAAAVIGGAVIGGYSSYKGAKDQAKGAKQAAELEQESLDKNLEFQKYAFDRQNELQDPFRQAGMAGQNRLLEYLGIGGNRSADGYGKYSGDFGMSDFQKDPGYQFRLSEGLKGLDASAAARGGLQSGAALKAAARYSQDYASGEYQNAFNRYQANRTNQLAPLQSLFGAGQSSANTMGNAAQNYAQNVGGAYGNYAQGAGEAIQNGANARASAYAGVGNSLNSAIGTGLNYYSDQQWMNRLNPQG